MSDPQPQDAQADDLPPELELVAHLLANGQSDAEAALAIGRSSKTIQRARRTNPLFAQRVRDLREARLTQVVAGLGSLLEDAVGAVRRGLTSGRTTDELRAAALVLDRYRLFRSDTELADLVTEMQAEIEDLRRTLTDHNNVTEKP